MAATDYTIESAALIVEAYNSLAVNGSSNLCCPAETIYSSEQLEFLPDEVLRLSSGCGHPIDEAYIDEGMTVVDIGSGAGADCLLAGLRVGPTGHVIGVDPSSAMREVAERNRDAKEMPWVEFLQGTSTTIPIDDGQVDLVVSNCVLSLSHDHEGTWKEISRILKPGGRALVSDIIGGGEESLESKTRCETGISWSQYRSLLYEADLDGLRVISARTVHFKDAALATSVTLSARRATDRPHHAVDIACDDAHLQEARELVSMVGARSQDVSAPTVEVRLLSLHDRGDRDVVELIAGGLPRAPLSVFVDGASPELLGLDVAAWLQGYGA
ncbi:methyltransferase domain-containing protein [Actinomyces bowdenii]|uniref:Arsenite methyltransferase n=1 Tax=Actinomyces bowdenii TaxID=131109 RepID=A0A853EI44_9ACTO|nr:methyltransferase domain-containing protein [Actinomyces bowdenii]MBF0696067.1 methyltransferase domain-containing protein [Actinomyces bowdenii]NYS68240.1 methyltransferase domain-containing protein [Actinomyces bowdenii]